MVELVMDLGDGDGDDSTLAPLSFIGLGSGASDLAERHEEILAKHLRDAV